MSNGSPFHRAARLLPRPVRDAVWRRTVGRRSTVRWGNLRRTRPVGELWGEDRGLPVDRRYIEDFMRANVADIRGRTLEIHGKYYAERFGGDRVTRADVLDIDVDNPAATIVGDLTDEAALPEGAFDCFVLTQTIQFIRNAEAAVANSYRCLASGGVLLLTVPTTSRLEPEYPDYWRWPPDGLREVLDRRLPAEAEREVIAYGNVLTAMAFLLGLAADELTDAEYADNDPMYPMVVCARVRKPA